MAKTFILSDESVNDRGSRILTSGIDLKRFKKNPIMLWMHRRDDGWDFTQVLPIGKWENIRIQDDKLLADPHFDENDKFAMLIKSKVESGFIGGCSVGINPKEFSTDEVHLVKGQTRATVTKSELYEASIVDLPSNKNTVRLFSAVDHIQEQEVPLINPKTAMAVNDENKFTFKSEDDLLTFMKEKFGFEPKAGTEKPESTSTEDNSNEFRFKTENSFASWLKEKFGLQPKAPEKKSETDTDLSTQNTEVETLKTSLQEKQQEIENLNTRITQLQGSIGAEDTETTQQTDATSSGNSDDSFSTYASAKETWDAVNGLVE